MKCADARGFTLIEVLVSLAIFGVMSSLAYQALGQTLSNTDLLHERVDRIHAIQRTMSFLGRDLIQASPRPVRDPLGDGYVASLRTSIGTDFALEVTRGGWSNPAGLPRGTLQRAAYRLEDGELLRYHWNVLDPTIANEPIVTELLEDVDSLLFRYRTHNGDWGEQWPPQGIQGSVAWRIRPQVVEVVLTLPDEGEIRRFFEVAP